jgi:hypothetical protein
LLTDDQRATLVDLVEVMLERQSRPERRVCRQCDLDACGRRRGLCPVTRRFNQ